MLIRSVSSVESTTPAKIAAFAPLVLISAEAVRVFEASVPSTSDQGRFIYFID
jgi:hypothetical protein